MAGKSLGTLTIGIVADIGAYAKGIDQAMTKTTEFQKSLDKSLGVIDNSYSKTMSSMAKFYQKQESDQNKAIQSLAFNTNSFEGLMLRREAAQEHLDSLFLESERTSIKYIAAQKGIENSYTQGVMRLKALGLGMEQAGDKTRLARHEMLNFGYQINDVVVSLASGQRPLTVFAQQGAQIGQIAASSGVGVKGLALAFGDMALKAGQAALAIAMNPVVIGLTAAVGGAYIVLDQFTKSLNDGTDSLYSMRLGLSLTKEEFSAFEEELKGIGGYDVSKLEYILEYLKELNRSPQPNLSTAQVASQTVLAAKEIERGKALEKALKSSFDAAVSVTQTEGDKLAKEYEKRVNTIKAMGEALEMQGTPATEHINALLEAQRIKFIELSSAVDEYTKKIIESSKQTENAYTSLMKSLNPSSGLEDDIETIQKHYSDLGIRTPQIIAKMESDIAAVRQKYTQQQEKQNERLGKEAERAAKEEQKRPDYIKSINLELDNEIDRAGMLNEAKEREARLDKISETLAKKKWAKLSDKEKKIIEDKITALEKEEKKQKAVDALYSGSSKRAVEEYTIQKAALLTALQKDYITQEEYNKSLYAAEEAYKAATDATYSFQKSLEETQRTYGVFGDELTIMKALTPEVMAGLTDGQIEAAKQSIYLEEALKRVNNELQNIWNDTSGNDETIAARIKALNDALAGIGEGKKKIKISQGYYDVGMQDVKASQNQSKFTKAGASSIYSETTGQYDELIKKELEWKNARESGLVSVTQYENAMHGLYSQQLQLDALNGQMKSPFEALKQALEGVGNVKISQGYYDVGMQDVKASQNQSKFTKAGASSIYSETTGQYDELIKKELEWKNARESGLVSVTQYENAMRGLYSQQLQLDALNGQMKSPFEAFSSGLDLYASSFKGTFSELQTIGQNFSQSLGDGIADAFARSVVQGDSFKESLHSLSLTILTELVGSIVQMGIKYALASAMGKSLTAEQLLGITSVKAAGSAANASTVAEMTATAPVKATDAALTSASTFGASALAGAAALGAILALALGSIAGFESGGYTGNGGVKDIAGVVHGKEFVLNASATAKNRPYLEAMNNGASFQDMAQPVSGGGVTIQQNVSVSGAGDKQLETMLASVARQSALQGAKEGYKMVAKDFNSNGTLRKTLRRK